MKNLIVQIFMDKKGWEEENRLDAQSEQVLFLSNVLVKNYAKKINSDYKLITKPIINFKHPTWERFQLFDDQWVNNYDNILILEDDFILSEKILGKNVIDKIDNFLIKNKNTSFSFYLGTIPFLFIPYNLNINRGIINIYTHSVIYSKKYREKVLNYNYKKIYCWDIFQNYFNNNRYFYNIPLVYQPIEDTENSKNWPVPEIIRLLWLKIGKITNSDNKPGLLFKLMYLFSYILSLLLLGILIYIIIYIWKKFI